MRGGTLVESAKIDTITAIAPMSPQEPGPFEQAFNNAGLWCLPGGVKLQEGALQALGMLAIARPAVLLEEVPGSILKDALRREAPDVFKSRALANLTEMLKVWALD